MRTASRSACTLTTRKFKASIHSIFGCTDCHADIKAFPARSHAGEAGLRHLPCRPAGRLRSRRPCQGGSGGQHQRRQVPGLPWQRSRDSAGQRSQVESRARQHSADLRRLPRAEVGDGLQRRQLPLPSTLTSRAFTAKRLPPDRKKLPSAPTVTGSTTSWAAGDPKSPINKFNVPATCAKCHADVKQEYVQGASTARQIARGNWQAPVCTDCHGIHTIKAPKDPNSSVAAANVQNTCGCMPRQREAVQRIRRAGEPRVQLSVQLSRHGVEGRLEHRGQLRQLPRRAQHSAVQRSAVDDQSAQPGEDLRQVPSRARTRSSSPPRFTWTARRRPTSAARSSAASASFTSG